MYRGKLIERHCKFCGNQFMGRKTSVYCCRSCNSKDHADLLVLNRDNPLRIKNSIAANKARGGRPVSPEALEKIREGIRNRPSKKGIKLGKYSDERLVKLREWARSPERRKHLSEALKGRVVSEETRKKLSERSRNKKPLTEQQRANHKAAMNRPEVRAKCSKGRKGKPPTRGTTGWKMPESEKLKRSLKQKGVPVSARTLEKLKANARNPIIQEKKSITMKRLYESEDMRKKRSDAAFRSWRDTPDLHKKIFYNWGKGINKAEQMLSDILNELYPGEWEFVGNGKKSVAGKCPDFVHTKGNRLVEMFGNYWHKPNEEDTRRKFFADNGYECAVVWEKEMKNRGAEYVKEIIRANFAT